MEVAYISAKSAKRKLKVLLAGSHSYLGNSLYHFLSRKGFQIIPLERADADFRVAERQYTWDRLETEGFPDCDFVINVTGINVMKNDWTERTKKLIEESRIETNKRISKAIKNSTHKPYAFISASCAHYYPTSATRTYDESFVLPPTPTPQEMTDPIVQSTQLSLPYFSRMTRAWEEASQVYNHETDFRSEDALKYLREMRIKHDPQNSASLFGDNLPIRSDRYEQLEDHDVRVVNMRMGFLCGAHSTIIQSITPYLQTFTFSAVGDGSQYVPWIHIDDALQMYLHALTSNITGPINCVAPEIVQQKHLFPVLANISGGPYNHLFNIPVSAVVNRYGLTRAPILTESLTVVPTRMLDEGFQFKYPSVSDLRNHPEGELEREIAYYGGLDRLPRYKKRSFKHY